jgi:hypothetical protein
MSPLFRPRVHAAAAVLVSALVMTGCGGGDDSSTTPPEESTSGESASEESATDGTIDGDVDPATILTDPRLVTQVQWLLDQLAAPAAPDEAAIEERFAPDMLQLAPPEELARVFDQLRPDGPYTVTAVAEGTEPAPSATVRLSSEAAPTIMTVSIDVDGLISGLFFQPDTAANLPEISSVEDLETELSELGEAQVVVGSASDGECSIEHTTDGFPDGGEAFPSGSAFKLLVLSALGDAVEAGEIAFDDTLTITDELRSLPSGELQDRPAGDEVSVEDAAMLMISISDNTATDLLIDAIGQDRIAATAADLGLDTDRILPLGTTRQFFQLGWQVDPGVRAEWAAASGPDERAAILDALPPVLDVDPTAVTQPRWADGVDWPLTGGELCAIHARLLEQAASESGAPIRGILSENPGVAVPDGVTYQAFKGGSAPGVLALTFLTEASDDAPARVLVVQLRSGGVIDEMRAVGLVEAGLSVVAVE